MTISDNFENWKDIDRFPNYRISTFGRVYNTKTFRFMVLSPTMQGELTVGLTKNQYQFRRSVKRLVAEAFVEGGNSIFNTPIQLDGNKENLHATNILWRPRWFAWNYTRQFSYELPEFFYDEPVIDITNSLEYISIFSAAVINGNLCRDIHMSIISGACVFPGGEKYSYVKSY